jgi:putative transposase
MVKVRDGQVRNKPVYAAIGVDLDGHKDILGMWAGDGDGESAKFWLAVLTELRNRGVKDIFFLVCDGLKGLPDSVNAVFPLATVQTCIIHLIRNVRREAPGLPNGGERPSSPACRSRPVKLRAA